MKLYEICFSPTGGTAKVSHILSKEWDCAAEWVDLTKQDLELPRLCEDDVCIISVPSYAGRVPSLAAERIGRLKGNGAIAVLAVVYGNRAYEDTLLELKDLLMKGGFRCAAAVAAVAEHSIVREIAVGRPDEQDQVELTAFARKIRLALENGGLGDDVTVLGNRPYRETRPSALKPVPGESCVRCGLCAKNCPAGAISPKNPFEVCFESCIACMRCVSICPRHARVLDSEKLAALTAHLAVPCAVRKENECFL